ncbi:hypothetical protein, partial [Paenibacillus dendritiformis]|uniref:hypothetical protein n=1 Tax=Paenibacillus dendritiformis TaxID=130049 RepID=UPI001B2FF0FC
EQSVARSPLHHAIKGNKFKPDSFKMDAFGVRNPFVTLGLLLVIYYPAAFFITIPLTHKLAWRAPFTSTIPLPHNSSKTCCAPLFF